MAQFQTQIPHPLADQLPDLLTRGRMADPSVGILFLVFISQCRFKGATMQIQRHDVGGGECLLREAGEEEFIDDASTRDPNRTLLFGGLMGRDHHAARNAIRPHRHSRAVVERAHHPTLRVGQVLIGRQFQANLDFSAFQEMIGFAAHHKRQPSEISEDGSRAILPVEAQQNTFFSVVMGLSVALYGRDCPTQFCSVFPIAGVSKCAEKLMRMRLQNRGTAPHDFPPLASGVAGSTQWTQTSLWSWPICRLWQSPLASCLARPIHIKDEVVVPLPVEQPA